MTKQAKSKPAADEVACPVAPLAREYAKLVRARAALDDDAAAEPLIHATMKSEDDGGLTPQYADKLLIRRQSAIQDRARQLCASSRIGIAFQMLMAHSDILEALFPGDVWRRVPAEVRETSGRLDAERQGIIWTAYKAMTNGTSDPDLVALESVFGRDMLTDAECIDRVLRVAA